MKMRIIFFMAMAFVLDNPLFSQDTEPTIQQQDTSYWATGLKGTFTFTQTNYSNWQAGGENSIALNSLVRLFANFNRDRTSFRNSLETAYGFTDSKSQGNRKTSDKLQVLTKFGYKIKKEGDTRLFWTSSVSFLTQFTDGFEYPNDSIPISKFMAPGYLVVNTGLEYKNEDVLSVVYSPVAGKWTFIQDVTLSDQGAFGVEPGEKIRTELGTTLTAIYSKEIAKNVIYDSNLGLFTNYIEDFGNIDLNWENTFTLKINDILSSTLVLHFIYDDDIDIPEFDDEGVKIGEGPRLQFKELFGLGVTVSL